MAAAKKKKGQLRFKFGINDERVPKLLGIVYMFIALYLFIAFFSYLFTWQIDQDRVLRFSGELLFQDLDMANWLGRLGAMVSNLFFYWGFGLPSFLLVGVLMVLGFDRIRGIPMSAKYGFLGSTFFALIFSSMFLGFVTPNSDFPWGGAFGSVVSGWLQSFIGVIGLMLLFIFVLAGIIIWNINPNFNNLTPQKAWADIKYWFQNLLYKKYRREPQPAIKPGLRTTAATAAVAAAATTTAAAATLRPGSAKLEGDIPEPSESKPATEEPKKTENLLSFESVAPKKGEKPESLKVGEAELEIKELDPNDPENKHLPTQAPSITQENENHSEPYDPTLELSSYENPVLSLLESYDEHKVEIDRAELEANKDQIIETLLNYKIEITKIRATIGPTVTLYEIVPAAGVRISRIKNLEDDIALSLSALGIRIIAPIPGRGTIGIEVPNKNPQIVSLKEVLSSEKFRRAKMDLPIALGKTIANEVFVADLAKMPHLLIAGATGQGKSVGINAVLISLLYKKHPSQVKLVLVDPKKVELFPYSKLENHFLSFLPGADESITTETAKVVYTLNALTIEMEQRYDLLKAAHARNIKEYNEKFVARKLNPNNGHKFLPFIVLVIDEFADLIMTAGKEIELPIGRLAQLSRAVGIHLIIATQRPSVNIITGVIKANFPARIAFKVSAKVDSRTILDAGGADQLIGRGDMLLSVGGNIIRLQCAFVDTPEVERVLDFIGQQRGFPEPYLLPEYVGDDAEIGSTKLSMSDLDDNWEAAAKLIVQSQHGSTSMIQRRMKLGYNRAGRIMDQLEALGIVGPANGSKPREVLVYDEIELERYLEEVKNRK